MKVLKYRLMTEVNHGTEEQPDIQQIFSAITLRWNEINEEIAKREAYNGEYTIEEIEEPISQQLQTRKASLSSTDYKIIKCSEAQLLGEELPYDIASLHAERQALRDKINELEQQLEANEEGVQFNASIKI